MQPTQKTDRLFALEMTRRIEAYISANLGKLTLAEIGQLRNEQFDLAEHYRLIRNESGFVMR